MSPLGSTASHRGNREATSPTVQGFEVRVKTPSQERALNLCESTGPTPSITSSKHENFRRAATTGRALHGQGDTLSVQEAGFSNSKAGEPQEGGTPFDCTRSTNGSARRDPRPKSTVVETEGPRSLLPTQDPTHLANSGLGAQYRSRCGPRRAENGRAGATNQRTPTERRAAARPTSAALEG